MMIHTDKCLELMLPTPKTYETQYSYIRRLLLLGITLNTRICRYIGIHNLHSIVPKLYESGLFFTQTQDIAECPFTRVAPPHPVIFIYMTQEQIEAHKLDKPTLANA